MGANLDIDYIPSFPPPEGLKWVHTRLGQLALDREETTGWAYLVIPKENDQLMRDAMEAMVKAFDERKALNAK